MKKTRPEPLTKDFPSTAIASLATGVLLHEWIEVHRVAQWLLGHQIWTHQFPSLHDVLVRAVKAQFPDMPVELRGAGRENWREHAEQIEERFGKMLTVRRGDGSTEMSPLLPLVPVTNKGPPG